MTPIANGGVGEDAVFVLFHTVAIATLSAPSRALFTTLKFNPQGCGAAKSEEPLPVDSISQRLRAGNCCCL